MFWRFAEATSANTAKGRKPACGHVPMSEDKRKYESLAWAAPMHAFRLQLWKSGLK
jgi:hypothetical protein